MKTWTDAHNDYINLLESKQNNFKETYGQNFSFTHPERSKAYVEVLRILSNGPMTKGEMLNALDSSGVIPHRDIDWTKDPGKRGHYSSMFISLHKAGLLSYDSKTHLWSLGPNAKDYMERYNNILSMKESQRLHIVFEYCDAYTNGEWVRQECVVSSVKKCKELYGLGVDCDYRIISIEEV